MLQNVEEVAQSYRFYYVAGAPYLHLLKGGEDLFFVPCFGAGIDVAVDMHIQT